MEKEKEIADKRIKLIAGKVKELRIKAGYSSAESFSSDHSMDRVQYWRVESGTNLTMKTLLKILDFHKISLEEFFQGL